MRTLNVRLAAILLLIVAVLGGAMEGLRRYQVRRKADFYLRQAEKALQQAELAGEAGAGQDEMAAYEDAVNNYRWYLNLRPHQADVLEKLGLLQADLFQITAANGPRATARELQDTQLKAREWLGTAVRTLEAALREEQGSERTAARRKLVDIYLHFSRSYADAKTHLTILLEKSREDGELWELLGTCQAGLRETDEAAKSFQRAIDYAPDRVNAYLLLASLLADRNYLNRPGEADQCMQKMLKANPDSPQAHLAYGEYLTRLTRVGSIDDVTKRPILLGTLVSAVLAQAVDQAIQALKLPDEDPDARLLNEHKAVVTQAVRDALKAYDGKLALDDPRALLLAGGSRAEAEAPDPKALTRARDQALKALQAKDAPEERGPLSVAAKRGVLVDAMGRALAALHDPRALILGARQSLLEEAVQQAEKARPLVATGRDALMSLYLREFSPEDQSAVRLAAEHGLLLKAMKRALAAADADRKKEIAPAFLGRTEKRQVLVAAVQREIKDLPVADDERQALSDSIGVLVDLMRHALRDCEPSSADRALLLQSGDNAVLARVTKEALAAKQGVLAEAVRRVLEAENPSSAAPLPLPRKAPAEALNSAIASADLPKQERNLLLLASRRGVLVDALKATLESSELAAEDRQRLLQPREDDEEQVHKLLARAVRRATQTIERTLEGNDRGALLLAAECALSEREYDQASAYADRGIELYPWEPGMYSTGATIAMAAGQPAKALAILNDGLEAIPRNAWLRWTKANTLVDMDYLDEALKLLEDKNTPKPIYSYSDLQRLPSLEVADGYIKARIEYERGQWLAAIQGFEKVRSGLTSWPLYLKQADYWTGKCYGYLENVDLELRAYRRALDLDPFFVSARAALADALARSGRPDEALKEYGQLMQMATPPEGAWLRLARLLFSRNWRLPPAERNWRQVEEALNHAEQTDRDSSQFLLTRMEVLIAEAEDQRLVAKQATAPAEQQKAAVQAQQLLDDAERMVLEARNKNPKEPQYWAALARLADRRRQWDRATSLLDEAAQKLGDQVALRIARAGCLVDRRGKETGSQLRQLAENADRFSEAQRLQLWNALGTYAEQVGDDQQAKELWNRVAAQTPNNLRVRLELLDLAFRSKDDAGIKRTLEEVERIEGRGPHWLYGEAVRLSLLAKGKDDKLLDEAQQLLAKARKLRPSWSRIPLVAATIYEQQGNVPAALAGYLEAIRLGPSEPAAIRRAVPLLYSEGRLREADSLLSRFEEIPPELLRTAGRIDLGLGRFDEALAKATQSAADSNDYRDHTWLGQLLYEKGRRAAAQGQTEEARNAFSQAEKSLQRALDLAGDVPETWVNMIVFLAGTGEPKRAEDVIQEARQKIPPNQRSLALARAYEGMGRPELAEQNYEEALAAAPQDPAIARYVADFYLRMGEYPQYTPAQRSDAIVRCEAILKRIIDGGVRSAQADVIWARRRRAWIFFARYMESKMYPDLEQALKLTEENLAVAGESPEDLRLKAMILGNHPTLAKHEDAAKILEGLPREQREASPDDRFMLWQIYLAQGAWSKATAQMLSLLAAYPDQAKYVIAYTSALLERKELQDAELWLNRLERLAPHHVWTMRLRAELLLQRGQYTEALDLLNRFVGMSDAQPADEAERSRLVAATLEAFGRRLKDLGQPEMAKRFVFDSETLWRKYVRERPGREPFLVLFLGRQDRIEEALRLLESVWVDSPPESTAEASMLLLRNPAATPEQLKRVEKVVQQALERFDRPISLVEVMAQAYASQERYREAEKFYREVIQKNSGAYRAMNNLALLLALQRIKLQEALELVTRAVELAGPVASMLDSRASVYMALGQPGKALDDLKKAIADEATPVRYFHQAQAYQQSGQPQAAIAAMKKAQQLGLQAHMLEPLERPAYEGLLKLLKQATARAARHDAALSRS
jgi:tetratricopeptide (TPR) repeat protein